MARHTHVIFNFIHRGKSDSFYGRCHCGKEELFATWWPNPPKGWSKKQWQFAVIGATLILRGLWDARSQYSDEELKKYVDKIGRPMPGLKKPSRKKKEGS